MVGRSLKATIVGIEKAEKALISKGWGRQELSSKVIIEGTRTTQGIDIQAVHKFFTGKSVDRKYFVGICRVLNLNWEEVAIQPRIDSSKTEQREDTSSVDSFIQEIEKKIHLGILKQQKLMNTRSNSETLENANSSKRIQEKHDSLTLMLNTSKSIGLDGNYIKVCLCKIMASKQESGSHPLNSSLQKRDYNIDNTESNEIDKEYMTSKKYMPSLEIAQKYSRFIVVGDSGIGKTNLLWHLATQCNEGQFSIARIPIFVSLKNYAESEQESIVRIKKEPGFPIGEQSSLFRYIERQFQLCEINRSRFLDLLSYGRALILLDGFNDIEEKYSSILLKEIFDFINDFSDNHFIVTTRKPSKNIELQSFEIFEIEDFADPLILEARERIATSIEQRCSTMRVLDMTQPIELGEIYTNVNILEKITSRRRLSINELMDNLNLDSFDRFGIGKITEKRIPAESAVERHSKLIILGKPGAGKTTFLKYIAIQCNLNKFKLNHVPVFITLKDFAEAKDRSSLFEYIVKQFETYGLQQARAKLDHLLKRGKILILLDGLDEVRKEDNDRISRDIRNFSEKFHSNCYIMTCRIAAREYTFEKFTEVEVADFDEQQIKTFSQNWFRNKDLIKAQNFIDKLEQNPSIKELAISPLLLTLLCLVFEETANFPANRSELYEEGLNVLLKKWDAQRNIERDEVYKKMSIQRREDLLSQLALITFERKDYFFKKKDAEHYISKYIFNLSDTQNDSKILQLDSEVILKSIEAQHGLLIERSRGIYSFSHLTFHEYFTARRIIANRKGLEKLADHVLETHWREVFLLAVSMLQDADELIQLMKRRIEDFVKTNQPLNSLLLDISEKYNSTNISCELAAVRALHLELIHTPYLAFNLSRSIVSDLNTARYYARELALTLENACALKLLSELEVAKELEFDSELARTSARNLDIDLTHSLEHDLDFARALAMSLCIELVLVTSSKPNLILRELKMQQGNLGEDRKAFKAWWRAKGQVSFQSVLKDIPPVMNNNIKQYYDANKLLIDCLNSDCYVTRTIREQIEKTLLLPVSEAS
jgi:predicted NACHT family NTPase